MANTMTLIASSTVGSGGAASIDFTSIPSTYTDLKILFSGRSSDSGTNWNNMRMTFNTSSANASWRFVRGYNNGTGSGAVTGQIEVWIDFSGSTASTFANTEIYIPNYASANNKSISIDTVTEGTSADELAGFTAALWSNTDAINAIGFVPSSGSFVQYSTAYLYGIKNS
jgi:hypothetical protein